jgi:nucleoside-diphosphate-sugar epimerase
VTALVHRTAPQGIDGADVIRASLADREPLMAALAEKAPFDAVVNCAGIASDVARRRLLMQVNHHGVVNLLECMKRLQLGRLVHISSTDVYGLRDFHSADESTPLDNNRHNGYPESKILAEQAMTATLPAERYAILRPAAVCGEGDKTLLPRLLAFLRGSPVLVYFGRWRGKNRWPLVNVRNVATAAFLAATCDDAAGQAYNLIDPPAITMEQYLQWVLRTFLPEKVGVKALSIPLPLWWLPGQISSVLSRALGTKNPIFEPSLYALYSVAMNLDFSSRKLEALFERHGEKFVDSYHGCT